MIIWNGVCHITLAQSRPTATTTLRVRCPKHSTMALASSLPDILNYSSSSSSILFPSNRVRFLPTDSVSSLSCCLEKLSLRSKVVCRSTYNVQVIVADNESEERLVNRFRREVLRAGIIQESKRRRFFENKQEKKKRKARDAARRNRKRRFSQFQLVF